jgi:hypothetical protein
MKAVSGALRAATPPTSDNVPIRATLTARRRALVAVCIVGV